MPKKEKQLKEFDSFDYPVRSPEMWWQLTNTVLFFDVVGFTKNTNIEKMMNIIHRIEYVMKSLFYNTYNWGEKHHHNHLIMIPTGDGYGIGFNPKDFDGEKILNIAKVLHKDLTQKNGFKIRMGIAEGLNIRHIDQNEAINLFGYGINIAYRVLSAAKGNHILVHESIATPLLDKDKLEDLLHGPFVVKIKHRGTVNVYNYFKDGDFGNSSIPK